MRQIAVYGKGGIGKSTITANLSAALSEKRYRVMQVGCDPKRDSTRNLMRGELIPTVLDIIRSKESGHHPGEISLQDIIREGFNKILCVEAGGPEPGIGCAGRGIITAINNLEEMGAYDEALDFVLYDVLGDVVCGGFAMPIREGYAEEIYVIVCGELMSFYAANNILKGIARFASRGKARLAGIICNSRMVENEQALAEAFAQRVNSHLIEIIPREQVVHRAELNRKTVIEYAPESAQADIYRRLADKVVSNDRSISPIPLEMEELEEMCLQLGVT